MSSYDIIHYQRGIQSNITSAASPGYDPPETVYTNVETIFISTIVGAAFLSAISVLIMIFMSKIGPSSRLGKCTYIPALFGSLIVSNLLQSMGTGINLWWVLNGGVSSGMLCSAQGGLKQAGNVGTAIWSFALALHAFRLLFLRTRVAKRIQWLAITLGWVFIVFIVTIGPLAIQTKDRGPYFGPSGYWCWVTHNYPIEQTVLEYAIEWTSAFVSFQLYVAVLLRVRGNLVKDSEGRWFLRWVSCGDAWQLGFARDYLDSCTIKLVVIIVWFPVTYTVLILPISIAHFAGYAGVRVPESVTLMADMIFSLGGFVNMLLFLRTRRSIPDLRTTPDFSTPRSCPTKDSTQVLFGVTPFTFPEVEQQPTETETLNNDTSVGSFTSFTSQKSIR